MGVAYFCNHVSLINKDQFRPPFVSAVGVGIVFILIVEHIASTRWFISKIPKFDKRKRDF